jgi:hypothetical protein
VSQIGKGLDNFLLIEGSPGLAAQDRQRLCALLDLLGTPAEEFGVLAQQWHASESL